MWHDVVARLCIDFAALTAAYNWEPYLALMPVTARRVTWRLGTRVLGLGLFYRLNSAIERGTKPDA